MYKGPAAVSMPIESVIPEKNKKYSPANYSLISLILYSKKKKTNTFRFSSLCVGK